MADGVSVPREIQELADAQGRKLGFLIAALHASDEVKAAFLEAAEGMTLVQIERLIEMLESQYLHEKTKSIDEELVKHLQEVKDATQRKRKALLQKTIQKINALATRLSPRKQTR